MTFARLSILALVAAITFSPAHATVFFSTYTPSDTAETHVSSAFPFDKRAPDASQTFDSFARLRVFQVGVVCCTFASQYALTEFVAPDDFTASHLILPLQFVSDAGGENIAFLVEKYDPLGDSWANARSDSWATVRGSLIGSSVVEADLVFGTNATASEAFFAERPISFEEGALYRIRAAHASGSIGHIRWYESDQPVSYAGQARQTGSGTTGLAFDLDYQLAFALTDGGSLASLASTTPEPASWMMMLAGLGAFGAMMRRKQCRAARSGRA